MPGETIDQDALKRRILFVPCTSKKALHNWIRLFLGLDIPDGLVDEDSTGSPMDAIWEIYERALKNDDPDFRRILCYAARDSFKTLGSAILEVLMIVHAKRSIAHVAAIEQQAMKAQSYVKDFFSKPYLVDFVVGDNKREFGYLRYEHKLTKVNLTEAQWKALPNADQDEYEKIYNYIKVLVCTKKSLNSEHVPFMVLDEVDLIDNPAAYEEAKLIPTEYKGLRPITLLISTRKYSIGMVQKEIDEAVDARGHRKLQVRHWNILDVTHACPPERHRPDLPRLPIYRDDDNLRALSADEYDLLNAKDKDNYVKDEDCYNGCLTRCRMYAMCQGRLAHKQKSKSPLLKSIEHTQNAFAEVSVEMAQAQLLCRKPSTEGLIYPRLSPEVHCLTASQIASKITGEDHPPNMDKAELIELLKARGVRFYSGMDFGYTHNFAVVTIAVDGNRAFVINVIAIAGLELPQRIEVCDAIRHFDSVIFPDTAYPADIKTFKRHGFRMKEWNKNAGSVKAGIEIVRMKLMPTIGPPQLFFLAGDEGVNFLIKRLQQYHWVIDKATGDPTDIPNDKDDDEADAFRYVIMNVFAPKGKITLDRQQPSIAPVTASLGQYTHENFARKVVQEQMGSHIDGMLDRKDGVRGRKGSFFFDL